MSSDLIIRWIGRVPEGYASETWTDSVRAAVVLCGCDWVDSLNALTNPMLGAAVAQLCVEHDAAIARIAELETSRDQYAAILRDMTTAMENKNRWLNEASARIAELEAEVVTKQHHLDVLQRYDDYFTIINAAGTNNTGQIVAMIEAAKKLPVTADGVRVVPGVDWVYNREHMGNREYEWVRIVCPVRRDWVATCYSTREAAEAALAAKGVSDAD